MKLGYLAVLVGLVPSIASADMAAADACAAGLSEHAKMIYEATKPRVTDGVKIADEIRAATRPLVLGGKLGRSDAQAAAPEAGTCLKLITQ